MRRTIFWVCVAILSIAGTAFGQATAINGTEVTANQAVGVGGNAFNQSPVTSSAGAQAQGGAGGNSNAQSGDSLSSSSLGINWNPTNISKYPDYKSPLPNMYPAGTPWLMPGADQANYFNALAGDLRYYVRKWTRAEVEKILKDNDLSTRRYSLRGEGRGFKWGTALRKTNSSVNEIEVRLSQIQIFGPNGQVVAAIGQSPEENEKDFDFIGDIAATGKKGKSQAAAFMIGLKIAMDEGMNMVVLKPEMNAVYTGFNLSPTGGLGSALEKVSSAIAAGLS
ncbi:MAG: hypothetical protein Q8N69_00350, partial [bacterium]|nr:hypothetical protein [bacterium]